MQETDLQALERFVAENDDLLALEEQIGRFNIFDALNVARVEIRHSNYLAWLLTPGESHGQGDLFLKAVLMDVLRKARHQAITPPLSPVDLDGADLQGVEVRREWRNIDLLIECKEPPFVIAVENKVDSGVHSGQLQRYEATVGAEFAGVRALYVFLTPEGDEASDEDWVAYSYADLHRTLTRTRKVNAAAIGGDVAVFLDHYLGLIGSRFMENVDLDKLCRQIYANHRRAMDLIWERVGTPAAELVRRIQEWLEQRPEWVHITTKQKEVEFIPAAWNKMLRPVGKRKTFEPEHWMTMRLRAGSTRLRLFVIVCPTTDAGVRKRTLERLLKDKKEFGFSTFFKRKELTEDWTRVLSEEVCPLPEEDEPDVDAVMASVEKRLVEFLKETAGLPAAMKAVQS
ncbi:MAG: PD-(D/E)XK nuclease family protein [Phycisphaerales bacterium]